MKIINCVPRVESAGEGKVIDLAAWKAENLTAPDAGRASALGQHVDRAELAATLAVTAAFVVLILRVLLF